MLFMSVPFFNDLALKKKKRKEKRTGKGMGTEKGK